MEREGERERVSAGFSGVSSRPGDRQCSPPPSNSRRPHHPGVRNLAPVAKVGPQAGLVRSLGPAFHADAGGHRWEKKSERLGAAARTELASVLRASRKALSFRFQPARRRGRVAGQCTVLCAGARVCELAERARRASSLCATAAAVFVCGVNEFAPLFTFLFAPPHSFSPPWAKPRRRASTRPSSG